ncbi:MAG: helix-turn-helix domain-containing protein [Candidatus Omnitrophota bacterium]|jgi:excisionase family DNA binding protein
MNRLIDIDELADYLKLKKQTIYNWLSQRKISGIKVGGVWRFDRKDVDSWLQSSKRQSMSPANGKQPGVSKAGADQ